MNYYDWQDSQVRCARCDWSGLGSATKLYECFQDGAVYMCPVCREEFGFVDYPTIREAQSDPRASNGDRMAATIIQSRHERFEHSKLKSVKQLPTLDPAPTHLTWDSTSLSLPDGEVRISAGDDVIWREMSFYENYRRFVEIASLLHCKYGDTLRDLCPTQRSKLDLYGDRMGSIGVVEAARQAVALGADSAAARGRTGSA